MSPRDNYYAHELQRISPRPDELLILVSGKVAAGKSTVAGIVYNTLRDLGLQVELDDGPDTELHSNSAWQADMDKRVDALAERNTQLRVVSYQLPRMHENTFVGAREIRAVIHDRLRALLESNVLDGLTAQDAMRLAMYHTLHS